MAQQRSKKDLVEKYRSLREPERKTLSEASVVHQFLNPFFAALGCPIHNTARYTYELQTQSRRPDMTLLRWQKPGF